ncbi:MAG: dihydroneopterin aldolase [Patescibacteria group bacterium]
MNKLTIDDLLIRGRHGETSRELVEDQSFELSLEISLDTAAAAVSDKLADTYDYKQAVAIAESLITSTHSVLIEQLAERIAQHILNDRRLDEVKVTLRKVTNPGGIPGITIKRRRSLQSGIAGFKPIDFKKALAEIRAHGATGFPLLQDYYRQMLLAEGQKLEYERRPEYVGPAKVREQLSSAKVIPDPSPFSALVGEFETLLNYETLKLVEAERPFVRPVKFNETSLQKYDAGSIGITPHLDSARCQDLVVILVLVGEGCFATCADRAGTNPHEIRPKPGDAILMRAAGFDGVDERPFHYLTDIREERLALGLRFFK